RSMRQKPVTRSTTSGARRGIDDSAGMKGTRNLDAQYVAVEALGQLRTMRRCRIAHEDADARRAITAANRRPDDAWNRHQRIVMHRQHVFDALPRHSRLRLAD